MQCFTMLLKNPFFTDRWMLTPTWLKYFVMVLCWKVPHVLLFILFFTLLFKNPFHIDRWMLTPIGSNIL